MASASGMKTSFRGMVWRRYFAEWRCPATLTRCHLLIYVVASRDGILQFNKRLYSFAPCHSQSPQQADLKITILFSGFKNPYKKICETRKLKSWIQEYVTFCRTQKWWKKTGQKSNLRRLEFKPMQKPRLKMLFKNSILGRLPLPCSLALVRGGVFSLFVVLPNPPPPTSPLSKPGKQEGHNRLKEMREAWRRHKRHLKL